VAEILESARPRENYIGGVWRAAESGETYEKHNPMYPERVVGVVANSDAADVDLAVQLAHEAQPGWAALSLAERGRYLSDAASALESRTEQVAQTMTAEMGKPLRDSRAEAARGAQTLRFAASESLRPVGEHFEQAATGAQVSTDRRPLGVVGLIAPWNFPCAIPIWKLAPALVYGNTAVLKVAYEAPLTGLHIAEVLEEAGLPAGVLSIVTGPGSKIGNALVRAPLVRAISFTGSVATGNLVRDQATQLGKRVQLELGGHNPLVVMEDAELERAADAAFAGAFGSAGQKCTATRRIYVHEAVYDSFRELLLARIRRAKVGDPADPEVEVGPIVSRAQFDDVLAAIERGRSEGGTLIVGGEVPDTPGYVIAPTVFEDVRDDSYLSCEEVFGPVTSLYRFSTLDEALERANALPFGLSASIFTSSLASALRFQQDVQAGLIHVNSQTAGADVHVPFGGIKASGFGPHEQGRAAMEFFTDQVTIYVDA
jgi:aldehyde dehydrogenase (NAD+)